MNGRSGIANSTSFHRAHNQMETHIHGIEQEAYSSVIRAFKAQSDAITWDKESLITELRKELRVSDEEHRELLFKVDTDETIQKISEWRKAKSLQPGMLINAQPAHDSNPSPTFSASHKKLKTSHPIGSMPLGIPSTSVVPNMHTSNFKRGPVHGCRGRKPKTSTQYPSAAISNRAAGMNRNSGCIMNEPTETATIDALIGRKVWTRWPDDSNFYEAVITDYREGLHALSYDMDTANETWEWVNLKEISPDDIRWEGENAALPRRGGGGRGGGLGGRGMKKHTGRGGGVSGMGRGRGLLNNQNKKSLGPSQNGVGKDVAGNIELRHTDAIIKEVEKVIGSTHPDPVEVEQAKKVLNEHEQALVDAISRLEDASDDNG